MMPFCDLRPHLTSPFSPRATPNGILLFSFAFPFRRVPFRPSQPERNFIFNSAYPPSARHFHPQKAPKRIIFPCIPHLPRPFSPSKSTKENFIFNPAFPVCRDLFYPHAAPNGILFSHSTSIPLCRGPRLPRCIAILSVLSTVSPPHGAYIHPTCRIHPTIVPEMRCAAPKRRNFPARKRYGRHKSGCMGIRPHKMDTRKECIHRRGRGGGGYIIRGLSAGGNGSRRYIIGDYRQGKE